MAELAAEFVACFGVLSGQRLWERNLASPHVQTNTSVRKLRSIHNIDGTGGNRMKKWEMQNKS